MQTWICESISSVPFVNESFSSVGSLPDERFNKFNWSSPLVHLTDSKWNIIILQKLISVCMYSMYPFIYLSRYLKKVFNIIIYDVWCTCTYTYLKGPVKITYLKMYYFLCSTEKKNRLRVKKKTWNNLRIIFLILNPFKIEIMSKSLCLVTMTACGEQPHPEESDIINTFVIKRSFIATALTEPPDVKQQSSASRLKDWEHLKKILAGKRMKKRRLVLFWPSNDFQWE